MSSTSGPEAPVKLTYTLASRASQLAQIQTFGVRDTLAAAFPVTPAHSYEFETSFMRTAGDKNQTQALYVIGGGTSGGKSLWTDELEAALLRPPQSAGEITTSEDGESTARVDMLVHCLKDMPTSLPEGCELGAILEREDPVDSLVVKEGLPYKSLDDLPNGSVVGTSSIRRVAQLRRHYPKLQFQDVRGNLNTRLAKLDAPDGPYSALILAKAGMVRLGKGDRLTADLGAPILYYAVGQAALAVEIRTGDSAVKALCLALNHRPTELKCRAERALLRVLEGGCSVPVGVHTEYIQTSAPEEPPRGTLTITGTVTSLDGKQHVEHTLKEEISSPEDAETVGSKLATILVNTGAKEILEEITRDKAAKQAAEAAKS